MFKRVYGSPQRSANSCGQSFVMGSTDLIQRSSSTVWIFRNKVTTASVPAPIGVEPQHPSTTVSLILITRSHGQAVIATLIRSPGRLALDSISLKSGLTGMNPSTTATRNANSTQSELLMLFSRQRSVSSPSTRSRVT